MLKRSLDVLQEIFRDHTRDRFCAGLRKMGIAAEMADRHDPRESIAGSSLHPGSPGGFSMGLISIANRPIQWINICRVGTPAPETLYFANYIVPDHRITRAVPDLHIPIDRKTEEQWMRIREKMGDPSSVGVGDYFGWGIKDRLYTDESVKALLGEIWSLGISLRVQAKLWIITGEFRMEQLRLWPFYLSIARYLLEMPLYTSDWAKQGEVAIFHEDSARE